MAIERVQKILAKAGIASRRKAEELITLGEVTVNGKLAKLGDKAELGKDAIKVRGKLLHQLDAPVYMTFFKPKNVISALSDPEGRPSLGDYLKRFKSRVYPIGRLDFTSEGLLLMTNDGDMAEKIQKRDDIPRVYQVKVKGHPDSEMIRRIERGGRVGNKPVRPHSVRLVKDFTNKALVQVVILDSGALDIKGLFEVKGFLVEKITRVAIGHLTLRGLTPGSFQALKKSQMQALLDQPELGIRRLEEEVEKARTVYRLTPEGERKAEEKRAEEKKAEAKRPPTTRPKLEVRPPARGRKRN